MSTPFLTYGFTATGSTAKRNLPDRIADIINVKDYGATGNGTTDDTSAIQAAFDAAYGSASAPHGSSNAGQNKPVYFPAGIYITTSPLQLTYVQGPWLYGDGINASKIKYTGTTTSTGKTNIVQTNGFNYGRVQDMSFDMGTTGNTTSANTCCFNWNWDNASSGVNTTFMDFINCGFYNATYGMLCADPSPSSLGNECDQAIWWNCHFDSCLNGIRFGGQNALEVAIFGGKFSNCSSNAINAPGATGYVPVILGTTFESNGGYDIQSFNGNSIYISDCISNSANFTNISDRVVIVGCRQISTTAGTFFQGSPTTNTLIEGCFSLTGQLGTNAAYFLRNNTFQTSAVFISTNPANPCPIREWVQSNLNNFTQINQLSSRNWGEGLQITVSDSTANTWGTTVTSSGGANHALIRFNGSNWTVFGV